ncbi:hypothetical protein Tco_1515424 [Tanacetum coccineum]
MNQQEIQQVAREETLVPSADKVKISNNNMRIDPTLPQKEETYQVILDIIKNSACYDAFLVTADVPEIYMQQFWFLVYAQEFKEKNLLYLHLKRHYSPFSLNWDTKGMFHKENVDFAKLIWEDFQYPIDYRESKLRSREIMPYPRFTKVIINHFLSLHKSIPKRLTLGLHTIKDDGVLNRLKFVRIGEDFQEYGLAIPDTMLTEEIEQSEANQAFIAYSTSLIPPKKTRGKGSQGKKQTVTPKKKSYISTKDNIIPEPDVALELGKSISKTEAEITEEARRVHETHECLVTEKPAREEDFDESEGEPANRPIGRRRSSEERLATDTMQAIKASWKVSRTQPHSGGSIEGAGITPEVPDESTRIFTTSSEGTGITLGVPNEVKGSSEAKVDYAIDWEEKKQDDDDYDRSIDLEETDDEDEYAKYKARDDKYVHEDEYVHDGADEEIKDVEGDETGKDDTAKADDEKTEQVKGADKQAGIEMANVDQAKDTRTIKDFTDIKINTLMDIQIQQEFPQIQSPALLNVHVFVIPEQLVPAPSPALTTELLFQRVSTLKKDVKELKQVDHSAVIFESIRSQVPPVVNEFLGSSPNELTTQKCC